MKVFEFDNYRQFLLATLKIMPRKGYGQLARIAQALGINPSIVTQVLKGKKDFTFEQANDLAELWSLSSLETDYFLALVGYQRAGKANLKAKYKRQIEHLRDEAKKLDRVLPAQAELTEEAKAIFYSQWYFSAARILSSIEGYSSAEVISEHIGIPRSKIKMVLDFLVRHGLCLEKEGRICVGPQSTHIAADSILVNRHHANWRQVATQRLDQMKSDELFFTSPVSISAGDVPRIRSLLVNTIEDVFRIVDPSNSEEALCLNIDWFRF